jgi:hypothetical protein
MFGRDDLIRDVVRSAAPLVVLRGDSGIGKSGILEAAQVMDRDALTPGVADVFSVDGSVQGAFLDRLSAVVTEMLVNSNDPIRQRTLFDFVTALIATTASALPKIIGVAIVDQVRLKLGDGVVEMFGDIWTDAWASSSGSIQARIAAFRGTDLATELLNVADEVVRLTGATHLSIALDQVECLSEGDIRLLADMARKSSSSVRIRAAVVDAVPRGQRAADLLLGLGSDCVVVHTVLPLEEDAIREWLRAEDLDEAMAQEIRRLTSGYPLYIGDAVSHLRSGGHLGNLTTSERFGSLVEQRWEELDSPARIAARRLCLFDRPPELDVILALLNVDPADWWDIADRLHQARLFTQTVEELPWFHDQRRRWVLERLSIDERRHYASEAIPVVVENLNSQTGWRYCSSLAVLVQEAKDAVGNQLLVAVARLTDRELSVAAALLELYAPQKPAVSAQAALGYAARRFGFDGALIDALNALADVGLCAVAANDWHAVVVPITEVSVVAAIVGSTQIRFGITTIPALASVIWDSCIAPLAKPFEMALYGVGSPRPGEIVEELNSFRLRATGQIRPQFFGCALMGEYSGVDLYGVVSTNETYPPAAVEQLRTARAEVLGRTFSVSTVLEWPSPRLRSERWLAAVSDVLRRHVGSGPNESLSVADEVALTAKTWEAMRSGMDHTERLATGCVHPAHFYYSDHQAGQTVLTVRGLPAGVTALDRPPAVAFNDPYTFLRLRYELQLDASVHVERIRDGRNLDSLHPAELVGKEIAARTRQFNRLLPRTRVHLNPDELKVWVLEQLQLRHNDSALLSQAFNLEAPVPKHIFLAACPPWHGDLFPIPGAMYLLDDSDEMRFEYAILRSSAPNDLYDEFREAFPDAPNSSPALSELSRALAELTGYEEGDLWMLDSARSVGLIPT